MTTIVKEVMMGTIMGKDYNKKVDNVAKNVSQYINMKQAGHRNYGYGYVLAQVLSIHSIFDITPFMNHLLCTKN